MQHTGNQDAITEQWKTYDRYKQASSVRVGRNETWPEDHVLERNYPRLIDQRMADERTWVPANIEDDHTVGRIQIDTDATSHGGDQE